MKKYLLAAILALSFSAAHADGVSCPEMAQMITDYEREKKAGGMSKVRAQTVNGILSASRKSYEISGCKNADLKTKNATPKEQK